MPFVVVSLAATDCLSAFVRFFVHRRSHCYPDILQPRTPGDGNRRMVHPDSCPFLFPLKCWLLKLALSRVRCMPIRSVSGKAVASRRFPCPVRRPSFRCSACGRGIAESAAGDDPSSDGLPKLRRSAESLTLNASVPAPRFLSHSACSPTMLPASPDPTPQKHPTAHRQS